MSEQKLHLSSRPLEIRTLPTSDNSVTFLKCDHNPEKMPLENPWPTIEREVATSSIVWVEYCPPELEETVYRGIMGKKARDYDRRYGISEMFGRILALAAKYGVQVACSDIACTPWLEISRLAGRVLPTVAAGTVAIPDFDPNSHFTSRLLDADIGMIAGIFLTHFLWPKEVWAFSRNRMPGENNYLLDVEDARRIFTERGIRQEMRRRKPGTHASYIGPHALVDRLIWNMEHPNDPANNIKSHLYRLMPGVPFSTRMWDYSKKYDSWRRVSNAPIR